MGIRDASDRCWFCERANGTEGCEAVARLYKEGGSLASMETEVIRVARCTSCKQFHVDIARIRDSKWIRSAFTAAGAATSYGLGLALIPNPMREGMIRRGVLGAGICLGYLIGSVTAWVAARAKHHRSDVKRLDGLAGFPHIATRLQTGWKMVKDPQTLLDPDSQAENE